jgi:hypothetical protein
MPKLKKAVDLPAAKAIAARKAASKKVRRLDEANADDETFSPAVTALDRAVEDELSSPTEDTGMRDVLEDFLTLPDSAIPQDPREVVRLLLKSPVFAG